MRHVPLRLLALASFASLACSFACGGGDDDAAAGTSSTGGGAGSSAAGSSAAGAATAGSGGASTGGSAGKAGSATAGSGTTGGGAGAAGTGTAGTGTAGTGTAGSGTSGSGTSGSGTAGGQPSTKTRSLAWNDLSLGSGGKDKAWHEVASNLDGLQFTDAAAPGHCKPVTGAKAKDVVIDGPKGEDNSFGKNLLPIFEALDAELATPTKAVKQGDAGELVRFAAATFGANEASLDGELFWVKGPGSPPQAPPASGDWSSFFWSPPVNGLAVSTGAGDSLVSKDTLKGEVKDDTWIGKSGKVHVVLRLAGYPLNLELREAKLTVPLAADHESAKGGKLVGVIPTADLVQQVKDLSGNISPSLCSGAALQSVLDQIAQASDIGLDGKQDETKTCDAVSFGVLFDATLSELGAPGPADKLTPACP